MQHLYFHIISYFKADTFYKKSNSDEEIFIPYSNPHKKPQWVKDKVIYLKVLLPNYGCRKIAIQFNKMYAHKNISVSKSYVYNVIKENSYEVVKQRRKIKHKVPKASPWQNGRIERLFGTMKESFKNLLFPTSNTLQNGLKEFRLFYNHIRPHQHLDGRTPSEAWDKKTMVTSKQAKEVFYFEGLCGNVAGFYFME